MAATLDDLLIVVRDIKIDLAGAIALSSGKGGGGTPPPPKPSLWTGTAMTMLFSSINKVTKHLEDIAWGIAGMRVSAMSAAKAAASAPSGGGGSGGGGPSGGFFAGLTTGTSKVVDVLSAATSAISALGSSLTNFISKANPVAVLQFTLALNDFQAVIGRALVPILARVTMLIRMMADAFLSLSPLAKQFAAGVAAGAAFGVVIAAVTVAIKALITAFGPIPFIVGALVGAFAGVAGSMASGKQLAVAFGAVIDAVMKVVEAMASFIVPIVSSVIIPVLNALAKVLQFVGGVVGTLLDSFSGVGGGIALIIGAFVAFGGRLGMITMALGTAGRAIWGTEERLKAFSRAAMGVLKGIGIGILVQVITKIAEATGLFELLGRAIGFVGDAIETLFGWIRDAAEWLGLIDEPEAKASSVGAAARPAQFSGFEEFAKKQYASAFSSGMDSIEAQQLAVLKEIRDGVKGERFKRDPTTGRSKDGSLVGDTVRGIRDRVREDFRDVREWLRSL